MNVMRPRQVISLTVYRIDGLTRDSKPPEWAGSKSTRQLSTGQMHLAGFFI